MRTKRTTQISIFDRFAEHEIGRELAAMSRWLDDHPQVLDGVASDLRMTTVNATGRNGMSAESVLRCALLKQHRQLSYHALAFHLLDSVSFQSFARLPMSFTPKSSTLHDTISVITAATWEAINRALLSDARQTGVERGQMLRIDSTVTDTPIHAPSDSSLLWDSVRVMVRLLEQADELLGAVSLDWHNHRRLAKRRMRAIRYTRGKDKKQRLYGDLLRVTGNTLGYLQQAQVQCRVAAVYGAAYEGWLAQCAHYIPLIERVVEQTQRRVLANEKVPATDKILSLFESHTDLIVKGARDIQYGHKINLSTGRSGLILDVVVETGNPADAERFLPMVERHFEHYGCPPRQVAADGGYASRDNLTKAKAHGINDVAFHKKRGLSVEAMVKSPWVYRKLRNFRAGIEAGISLMKRRYGLARCTWKGLTHFRAYVWSSVVAHNFVVLARITLKPT